MMCLKVSGFLGGFFAGSAKNVSGHDVMFAWRRSDGRSLAFNLVQN